MAFYFQTTSSSYTAEGELQGIPVCIVWQTGINVYSVLNPILSSEEQIMKNRTAALLIVSALVVFSLTCDNPTGASPGSNSIDGNTGYIGEVKMSISVPDGWTMAVDTTISFMKFDVIGYNVSSVMFAPNFNILLNNHSGTADMEEILDLNEKQMLSMFEEVTTVSKQVVQIDGVSVGEYVYTMPTGDLTLWEKQWYIINNNKDIIVTFADLLENHNNDSADFMFIENSITFE